MQEIKKDTNLEKLNKYKLFTFSTEHLDKKDKVRFFYALKGRNEKEGIVQRNNAKHLGSGVILVPYDKADEFQEFFEYWNCKYEEKEVLMQ